MILGLFGGTTTAALAERRQKIASQLLTLNSDVEQAIADRTAAIAELKEDLNQLTTLKGDLFR